MSLISIHLHLAAAAEAGGARGAGAGAGAAPEGAGGGGAKAAPPISGRGGRGQRRGGRGFLRLQPRPLLARAGRGRGQRQGPAHGRIPEAAEPKPEPPREGEGGEALKKRGKKPRKWGNSAQKRRFRRGFSSWERGNKKVENGKLRGFFFLGGEMGKN